MPPQVERARTATRPSTAEKKQNHFKDQKSKKLQDIVQDHTVWLTSHLCSHSCLSLSESTNILTNKTPSVTESVKYLAKISKSFAFHSMAALPLQTLTRVRLLRGPSALEIWLLPHNYFSIVPSPRSLSELHSPSFLVFNRAKCDGLKSAPCLKIHVGVLTPKYLRM